MGMLLFAAANKITPLAWLTGIAVFKFLKKKRFSIEITSGLCFFINLWISSWIIFNLSPGEKRAVAVMHPKSTTLGFSFRSCFWCLWFLVTITPYPVGAVPGSMPKMIILLY